MDSIPWKDIVTSGLRIIFVLAMAFLAYHAIKFAVGRFAQRLSARTKDEEARKRITTLARVVSHLCTAVMGIVAAITVLGQVGVDVGPILAAVGVVGLAVGFGAQTLVKDVITGFFILLENQARTGDFIAVGSVNGIVESINLRMLVLRDENGNVHYVPHSQVGILTNMTKEFSRLLIDVGVAYREDADAVMNVLKEVGRELSADPQFKGAIMEPYEVWGIEQLADSAVVIRTRITTKPMQQWIVARELRRRIKKAFDDRNIEMPFPHITMYMGTPKTGDAPPMMVKMKNQ